MFRTDVATMQTASQHVYEVNEQIQAQLSSLMARLEPLAAAWRGDASVSFQNLKAQYSDAATRLNGALRGIGDSLVANTGNYASTEETNRSGFTGISSVLG
jgi:WXG100 family type VII secretion target